MLTSAVAHQGELQAPHDLWPQWLGDPVILASLALAAWAYHRGASKRAGPVVQRRSRCFWGGTAALAVALLSPLDVVAGELASGHMVQHILLVLVAAPLLALSAPWVTIVGGAPRAVRTAVGRWQRRLSIDPRRLRALPWPAMAWLSHTITLWFWHASVPYEAALEHDPVHALEHATFLLTGILFWSVVVPVRRVPEMSYGHGALLVFTMAMQSVFLAALLTFATSPWYDAYGDTAAVWGIEPLADQQLAGAIMWVPAGLVYVGVGVVLMTMWVRHSNTGASGGDQDGDWGFGDAPQRPADLTR